MPTNKFDSLPKKTYDEARNLIQTGDIFFTAGEYAISKMIGYVSDSIMSHVGFVFTWNDRVLLLESVEDDGVRAVPLRQYAQDYESSGKGYRGKLFMARYKTGLDETKIRTMLGKAADKLNKKYDRGELADIMMRISLNIGHHTDNEAYICSEFVDICFKEIGIQFQHDSKGFIAPEHIAADDMVEPLFEIVSEH